MLLISLNPAACMNACSFYTFCIKKNHFHKIVKFNILLRVNINICFLFYLNLVILCTNNYN